MLLCISCKGGFFVFESSGFYPPKKEVKNCKLWGAEE